MLTDINTLPLTMVPPGATVELVTIQGGKRLRQRLADMGLNVGMSVRVMQGGLQGPIIVAVKEDARLALGHGVASQVIVVPRGSRR